MPDGSAGNRYFPSASVTVVRVPMSDGDVSYPGVYVQELPWQTGQIPGVVTTPRLREPARPPPLPRTRRATAR